MVPVLHPLPIPHLPADHAVYAAAFQDVQNAAYLRQQLLDGNTAFEYAFVDARMILSTQHLAAAIWRAVNDSYHGRMRSKNVHSEIVFCLSPTNNITQAFQTFGLSPDTTALIAVKVAVAGSPSAESVQKHLEDSIEGTPVDLQDELLSGFTDLAKVRKVYKLDGGGSGGKKGKSGEVGMSLNGDTPQERMDMEAVVVGSMALRGL